MLHFDTLKLRYKTIPQYWKSVLHAIRDLSPPIAVIQETGMQLTSDDFDINNSLILLTSF